MNREILQGNSNKRKIKISFLKLDGANKIILEYMNIFIANRWFYSFIHIILFLNKCIKVKTKLFIQMLKDYFVNVK